MRGSVSQHLERNHYDGPRPSEEKRQHETVLALGLVLLWLGAGGCANMSPRQQRALSGGAIGAAAEPQWERSWAAALLLEPPLAGRWYRRWRALGRYQ